MIPKTASFGRGLRNVMTEVSAALGRWRSWCAEASGLKRGLLAMGFGAVAVFALPPVHFLPALIPAFVGLAWLVESSRSWKGACAVGWWFGFGYFCVGLYWIANALLTKPDEFGALIPVAIGGLSALLAGFTAIAAGLASLSRGRGVSLVLALAGGWAIAEWLRSFVLTGFPWNLIASVWAESDPMLQMLAGVGPYGLGLLTVAVAGMPAVLVGCRGRMRNAILAMGIAFACAAVVWIGGAARLGLAGPPQFVDGIRLRLVQPNIEQTLKWQPELRYRHVLDQMRLGAVPASKPPTHIIWPEVAAPLVLDDHPDVMSAIGAATPEGGLTLLGALRRSQSGVLPQLWNSLWAIDAAGRTLKSYDKAHLVPFGEYVPFREIIGLANVTGGNIDFTPGPGRRTLRLPATPPVSPLICYEVIFPRSVVDDADRPGWILNITNDGWYGYSAGPYQHFMAARMRAIEEGIPLVRVANTGISGIIDPYGRITKQLGLEMRGVIDGQLPRSLPEKTIYARIGNEAVLALAVALVLWPRARAQKLDV